jgi:ATP phosphoribosyltransferase
MYAAGGLVYFCAINTTSKLMAIPTSHAPERLKIAVQKSGRLTEKSIELLARCGLKFDMNTQRLIAVCENYPVNLLFLRDDDIPEYVADGIADLGIVGRNVLEEKGVTVPILRPLGFGKCRLMLAVPTTTEYKGLEFFQGKTVATTYPALTARFFAAHGIQAHLVTISGSVEISTGLGLSDAICDLVSTGSTLLSNGLKAVETVLESESVLVANPAKAEHPLAQELLFRINSVYKADTTKYIMLNARIEDVPAITSILPGVKSPTVVPLAEAGWVAVHSVIPEADFWQRIHQLKAAGAEGILVMPIEKLLG